MHSIIEIIKKYELEYSPIKSYNDGFTDKWSLNKETGHSYAQNFYEKEFLKYKNNEISLLEIGIMTGGSLKLWKEYFINAKKIVGVDITNQFLSEKYSNIEGVEYYFRNAYDIELVKMLPNFDIIIDDGPHSLDSQVQTLKLYLPKLNKDGILIIEDIQEYSWFNNLIEELKNLSKSNPSSDDYIFECLDFRETLNRHDDMMFVVMKK